MRVSRSYVIAVAGLFVVGACDDDPSRPSANFSVAGCPSVTAIDQPVSIAFTGPVSPGTVTASNFVVTSAETGVEIPGAINLDPATNTVVFSPSEALAYNTRIRVRVNNVLADVTNQAAPLFVCEFTTPQPPITELFWRVLPPPTGDALVSATLPDANTGIVTAERVTLFKRVNNAGEFAVIFEQPHYSTSYDADFLTTLLGYGAHYDFRVNRGVLTRTLNGGASFDTVYSMDQAITRLYFENYGGTFFGSIGGGTCCNARFLKYTTPNSFAIVNNFGFTGAVLDIDFETDTMRTGAASTDGTRAGTFFQPGTVFFSDNRGLSWTEVAGVRAGLPGVVSAQDYTGTSVRNNNEIWVTGTNGYVLKLTRAGANYTFQRVLGNLMTNPDSTTQDALIYGDIEFAPDNSNKGWLVGAQQIGLVNGTPRYQGFIFETRDGGNSWVRQGVAGAEAFGAAMPRLRRIVARTSNHVWIVGDGGFVIDYAGINP